MTEVKSEEVEICVHGTKRAAWMDIQQTAVMSSMERQHIHFATQIPGRKVVSGGRLESEVLIFLDVEKAEHDGMKLWRSENDVLLTRGFTAADLNLQQGESVAGVVFNRLCEEEGFLPMKYRFLP